MTADAPLAYYNEIDKDAAAVLRELIALGVIADGVVDDRDIRDISPDDLEGYTQCHLFAGQKPRLRRSTLPKPASSGSKSSATPS